VSDFLFSFHSEPAARLYAGLKRHEFRRVRVAISPGDRILVYEVAPISCVTGQLTVLAVHHGPPEEVLALEEDEESRAGARAYVAAASVATAIEVLARRFERPLALSELGLARPPMSYCRLPTSA